MYSINRDDVCRTPARPKMANMRSLFQHSLPQRARILEVVCTMIILQQTHPLQMLHDKHCVNCKMLKDIVKHFAMNTIGEVVVLKIVNKL